MMELRYLEIFCKVVELGSFSKAAERMYLTQPTVSIHIKSLEGELETKLLDRMGRKVIPTAAGEVLYKYSKEIVRQKEEALLAMHQLNGKMRGRLILGGSTIPAEYILPEFIGRFKKEYPNVFPSLIVGDTKEIYEMTLDGDIDMGVIGSIINDNNIVSREFMSDELILVAPAGFKNDFIDIRELYNLPLIQREVGSGSRVSLEKTLKDMGIAIENLNIAAEMGSTQAEIRAIKSGMGLAFISKRAVITEIEDRTLKHVSIDGLEITRNFYIITHRLRYNSPICKTFIDFLTEKAI